MGYFNKFDSTYQDTTMRVYVAWIRIYYVLCSKAYDTFGGLFWDPR